MKRLFSLALLAAVAVAACDKKPEEHSGAAPKPAVSAAPKAAKIDRALLAAFQPVTGPAESKENPITDDKVKLGRQLYFETRLSKNHDISCATCHGLETFGVDNKPVSEGHKKQLGTRNSPTVYNAAFQFAQFWDARAKTVEEQAQKPITNAVEMAIKDDAQVVAVVKSIPEYVASFKKAFPDAKDPLTIENVGNAIGAFERTLVTTGKWDKYLGGDDAALSDAEKAGLAKYLEVGCQTCHMGKLLGGSIMQKLGLVKPWDKNTKDQGRFEVTKQDADKMMFKVPQLRNVAKTAPYYHDGSVATLEEATKLMAEYQLGKKLTDEETASIVTFLKALTDDLPAADLLKQPELPPKSAKTPKPDAN
jgi:cytochrome c peroxidase